MTVGISDYPLNIDTLDTLIRASNRAQSTLSAPISDSDLLIPLTSPGLFPSSGIGTLQAMTPVTLGGETVLIPNGSLELFRYDSISGSNLVIPSGGRGIGGTTPLGWMSGDYCQIRITKEHLAVLADAIIAIETKVGAGDDLTQRLSTIAGETVSGHRAVFISGSMGAYYSDKDGIYDVIGLTAGAAIVGNPVEVVISGQMIEPSWSWSQGPVYLGSSGNLTQTPPLTGAVVEIGQAVAPTKLIIRVQTPII